MSSRFILVDSFSTQATVTMHLMRDSASFSSALLQVLNAAMLYWPMPNVLYVEGYALDRFAEGLWALQPVHQNRVCSNVSCDTVLFFLLSIMCLRHIEEGKKED